MRRGQGQAKGDIVLYYKMFIRKMKLASWKVRDRRKSQEMA